MTMTQTALPSGQPTGFSHLESPLPGPVIPAALRRQARALRTVSRHEAERLIIKRGAPFLHAASERYVSLPDAIEVLGVDGAALLAQDRRSLLRWPDYYAAVELNLHILLACRWLDAGTDDDAWLTAHMGSVRAFRAPEPFTHPAGPCAAMVRAVLSDAATLKAEQRPQHWTEAPEAPVVSAAQLARLLHLTAYATAGIHMNCSTQRPPPTVAELRGKISAVIDQARRNVSNLAALYDLSEEGFVTFNLPLMVARE